MPTWKLALYRLWHTVDRLNEDTSGRHLWAAVFLLPALSLIIVTPILIYSFSYDNGTELPTPLILITYISILLALLTIPIIVALIILRGLYNRYMDESGTVIQKICRGDNYPIYDSEEWRELVRQWMLLPVSVPRKSLLLQAGIPIESAVTPQMNKLSNEDLAVMAGLVQLSQV